MHDFFSYDRVGLRFGGENRGLSSVIGGGVLSITKRALGRLMGYLVGDGDGETVHHHAFLNLLELGYWIGPWGVWSYFDGRCWC